MSEKKEAEQEPRAGQAEAEPSEKSLLEERKRGEELMTKLRYLQADFENFRKRTDKEMAEVREASVRNLAVRLLSVVDELALAIENARRDGNLELLEGIKMIHKNLVASLEAEGLERIQAVGKPFDPRLHEAVEKVQGSAREDTVVGEIRPGYAFRGQVIRPSMVKVELAARGRNAEGSTEDE